MATELRTLTWCDVHLVDSDEREPATATYDQGGQSIDLCATHAAPFLAAAEMLETYGRKASKRHNYPAKRATQAPAAPAGITCPVCKQGGFLNEHSLGTHARGKHGMGLAEIMGRPAPFKCGHRGCKRNFSTVQGKALHERTHETGAESG